MVGYNTLGHCFFLEDGNERDNVLVHNLGLVTRPGSLLPSDRDADMCAGLSVAARLFRHSPNVDTECMLVYNVFELVILSRRCLTTTTTTTTTNTTTTAPFGFCLPSQIFPN